MLRRQIYTLTQTTKQRLFEHCIHFKQNNNNNKIKLNADRLFCFYSYPYSSFSTIHAQITYWIHTTGVYAFRSSGVFMYSLPTHALAVLLNKQCSLERDSTDNTIAVRRGYIQTLDVVNAYKQQCSVYSMSASEEWETDEIGKRQQFGVLWHLVIVIVWL